MFNVNIQEWLGVEYIYNSESQSLSYNGSTVHVAVENVSSSLTKDQIYILLMKYYKPVNSSSCITC